MTLSFTASDTAVLFADGPYSTETSAEAATEKAAKLNEALVRVLAAAPSKSDPDPDNDGDDDTNAKGDKDHDFWTPDGKKKPGAWAPAKKK